MSGKPYLRVRFNPPKSSSASVGSSGLTTPSVPLDMRTRGSVMASKENKKRGAPEAGEEVGAQKKPRTRGEAIEQQQAFKKGLEDEFETMPTEPKKTKAKGGKEGKGTKRKAAEAVAAPEDESLGIFPASQKIAPERTSQKTRIHTKQEAKEVMQEKAEKLKWSTLEDTLDSFSAIPLEAGVRDSQVVVLPLGYLLEPPVTVTVKGKAMEVQPNSRLPSREGIERIKSQFRANGYSKEAAVMIGVLSISLCSIWENLLSD
jgi:hypothetical protein